MYFGHGINDDFLFNGTESSNSCGEKILSVIIANELKFESHISAKANATSKISKKWSSKNVNCPISSRKSSQPGYLTMVSRFFGFKVINKS